MPKINSVSWANVRINDRNYWQALVIGDKVVEREVERVKQEYGTDHLLALWEEESLLLSKPEVILIGNGWSELLKVSLRFKKQAENLGIALKILPTPEAAEEYNRLLKDGKKVNLLIHTTC